MGPQILGELAESCGWKYFDRVTSLELRGPNVDDQTAMKIFKFAFLQRLALDQTQISPTWINQFQADHPDCTVTVNGNTAGNILTLADIGSNR